MTLPFVSLCLQTLIMWVVIIYLHRKKSRFTLIPLYVFIALLTLLTHNLSDLGFAVVMKDWYFLISSFSFFTTLMMGILFLYLFEGPRATRFALIIILFTSLLYIGVVWLLGMQVDTSHWVILSLKRAPYYFWSILAIVVDIFFISIFWEILKKMNSLPLIIRIFLVFFSTFALDTIIFVSGVFGGQAIYSSVLKGDLVIRFILACFATPIVGYFLKTQGYTEGEVREEKNIWRILNFKSDLENKIQTMEEAIKHQKELEAKLNDSQEQYHLALEGANAGIWDWNVKSGFIMFSKRFCNLIGFEEGELPKTIEEFKAFIHPDDREITFKTIQDCFESKKILSLEYRLKNKNGTYRWYLKGGITKYDRVGKVDRMVGSIIDIDEKKQMIDSYKEKVEELEKLNSLMVGREIQMVELKEEIKKLKSS